MYIADVSTEKRLYCGHTGTYYRWERAGRRIYDNNLFSNTTSEVLTLSNVDRNDNGIYRCEYYHNGWQPADFYLVVKDTRLPMIYLPSNQYVAVVGAVVRLKCTFGQTIPKTTAAWWTKFNNGLYMNLSGSDDQKYLGSFQSIQLNLFSVTERDSGEYRCNGQTKNGQNFLATQLMIGNKPQPPATGKPIINVMVGMEVTLSCIPQFAKTNLTSLWWGKKWYDDFPSINYKNKNKYSGGNLSTPNLTIKQVHSSDAADYRCNVANIFGTSYVESKVVIGRAPSVRVYKRVHNPVIGDPVTLDCVFTYADKFCWKRVKNGQEEPVDTARTSGESTQSLTIQSVEQQDDGEYRCYGSNDISTANSAITVLSGHPPVVNISKDCYVLRVGDNVTINVIVKHAPMESTINWRQEGNIIYNNTRQAVGELRNPFLTIRNVELKDAGNYTLFVKNKYGNNSGFTVLKVIYIPLVTTTTTKVEVNKGVDTVLFCSHDSNPTPTHVYWTKNGVNISAHETTKYNGSTIESPSLVIYDTGTSDSGTYVCSVSNKLGFGYSKPLQLVIRDTLSSERKEYSYKTPLIITLSVIVIILFFVGLMVCYKRRQRNISHYENPDVKQGDVHRYSTARNVDEYDLPNQTDDNNTVGTTGSLDDRNEHNETRSFMVPEFLKLLNEKDKYTRQVQLEFKNLSESVNPCHSGSEYHNETTSLMKHNNPASNTTYQNTTLTIKEVCTFIL
ncbi:inactive tyrosine-protein kinase 7-like [Mytilus trossulus]|uniref:inactive tyrosine-protein kinase 7-like n=1 Tax=Mytilus trossulus TaxID=6551 RepID=UPI0030045AAE